MIFSRHSYRGLAECEFRITFRSSFMIADGFNRFLWVEFQLDHICSQSSDRNIRKALQSLPENMEETYERILSDIEKKPRSDRELAKKVLMWLAYAQRPFKLGELSRAVAMESDMESLEDVEDAVVNEFESLSRVCGNLVTIDFVYFYPNSTIRFVHYTVQEFLIPKVPRDSDSALSTLWGLDTQLAHEEIARICIQYMLFLYSNEEFVPISSPAETFDIYASNFWHHHVRMLTQLNEELWALLYRFINSGNLFHKSIYLFKANHYGNNKPYSTISPSTIAIVLDLPLISNRLAEEKLDEKDSTEDRLVAFQWAAEMGSSKGVEWLLARGFDINGMNSYGYTPLYSAVWYEQKEMVQLLLDHGADVNKKGGPWGNVLQAAAPRGNKEIIQLLLENGADVNAYFGRKGNALHIATLKGDEDLVRFLCEKGADINALGGEHGSVLQAAFASGNESLVRLLLDKGAEPTVQAKAFVATAEKGNQRLVEMLLEMGLDVNSKGGRKGSVLKAAIWSGNKKLVEFLIEKGAKVNSADMEDGYYGSPLHTAAIKGNEDIIQLLLDSGAEVNKRSGNYGNPFHAAIWNAVEFKRDGKLVQLLLDNGADVNSRDKQGSNALQLVACKNNLELARLLLENGADVNMKGGFWKSAMEAARVAAGEKMLDLLREYGGVAEDR